MNKLLLLFLIVLFSCKESNNINQQSSTKNKTFNIGSYSMDIPMTWNDERIVSGIKTKGFIITNKKDTINYALNTKPYEFQERVLHFIRNDSIFYSYEHHNKKTSFKYLCLENEFDRKEDLRFTTLEIKRINNIKRYVISPKKSGIGQTSVYIFENKDIGNKSLYIGGSNLMAETETDLLESIETLKYNFNKQKSLSKTLVNNFNQDKELNKKTLISLTDVRKSNI